MSKLSVIIPVYNASPYVERCIRSILSGDFRDIEVIAVNDGSRDDSLKVLRELSREYSCLKVIDKPNGGVSSARNFGMDASEGDYMMFVDADDYVNGRVLSDIIMTADETNADLAMMDFIRMKDSDLSNGLIFHDNEFGNIESYTITSYISELERVVTNEQCWNKLFKTSIIKANNLKFDSSIKMYEDGLFMAQYYRYCAKIVHLPINFYYYITNGNSANSKFYAEDLIRYYESYRSALMSLLVDTDNTNPGNIDFLNRHMAFLYLLGIYAIYRKFGPKKGKLKYLRLYWNEASKYDQKWSYQLDSGVPRIIGVIGRKSIAALNIFLRSLFFVEKLKNK